MAVSVAKKLMSGERLTQDSKNASYWPERANYGADDSKLRSRTSTGHSSVEDALPNTTVGHTDLDFHLAVPVDLGATNTSPKPQNSYFFDVVYDRVLDHISHKESILATVNYIALTVILAQFVRAIIAVDVGNAVITLAVGSVSLIIYLLSERAKKRELVRRQIDTTSDRIFQLADKERERADEASRHLREEERQFQREQIKRLVELAADAQKKFQNARQRSHAYGNALNGVVLAHRRLIELYEDAGGPQVPVLLRADRILDELWARIEQLNTEEADHDDLPPLEIKEM